MLPADKKVRQNWALKQGVLEETLKHNVKDQK